MSYNQLHSPTQYQNIGEAFITPSDTVDNLIAVKYIQATTAGHVVFRHKDGSLSVAVPLAAGQSFGIGSEMVAVHSTGSSSSMDLIAYKG